MSLTDLREFYQLQWPHLYAISRARLRDPDDAEDVVQELFLRLVRRCDELRADEVLKFATKALRHLIIDCYRDRGKGLRLLTDQEMEKVIKGPSKPPEHEILDQPFVEMRCRQIISEVMTTKLSRAELEAFQAWIENDRDRSKAAFKLGITLSAFSMRLHHGIEKLRQMQTQHKELFAELPQGRLLELMCETAREILRKRAGGVPCQE